MHLINGPGEQVGGGVELAVAPRKREIVPIEGIGY
jgi:hypothetical protein